MARAVGGSDDVDTQPTASITAAMVTICFMLHLARAETGESRVSYRDDASLTS